LEYGSNITFNKSNGLIPGSSDLAATIGYRLNDYFLFGVGAGYKFGMGSIQHIEFSNQGINFRSFLDFKIKNQLFISGGYEANHNSQFKNIAQLKDFNAWQSSGLLGLGKKYRISKKIKGTAEVLFDFLYRSHLPVSQPIVYRLGYKI
jgi:hypothetical protein